MTASRLETRPALGADRGECIPRSAPRSRGGRALAVLAAVALAACGGPVADGVLWYAGRAVCGFTKAQVLTSNGKNPAVLVTSSPLTEFNDLALDKEGNVWAVGAGSNQIWRFPAAALKASGEVRADLVIESQALQDPGNLAFDKTGNLWVVNRKGGTRSGDDGTIVRFDAPHALRGTQSLIPSVQIASTALYLPGGLAIDASGSLWVTSWSGIVRYDATESMTGAVTRTPNAVIATAGYAGNVYFYAIAFDAGGALWASAAIGNSLNAVVKFGNPGSLSGSSSPGPAVTIAGGGEWLPAGGLAFDQQGSLWVATSESIVQYFDPGSLNGAVNPAPSITLNVFNSAAPALNAHLVFFPSPAGLPLY